MTRNSYPVIRIGNQLWMAENLRTTTFNDGTNIPIIYDNKLWSRMISPGYCSYNNDAGKYKTQYGILYNGYTVSTGKLCPLGWHVPSEAEWLTLTNYCGENAAGGKLKKRDTLDEPKHRCHKYNWFCSSSRWKPREPGFVHGCRYTWSLVELN